MHLTKRTLSFIVTEALRGRTWVDKAVFDSPGDIGSIRVDDEGGLFIAVFCDEWDQRVDGDPDGDPIIKKPRGQFKLVVEVGASKPVTTESDETGAISRITATDAGLEWQIALISRQVMDTLLSDVNNEWAKLFRRFMSDNIKNCHIRRGGPPNDGRAPAARYASCVSIFQLSVVCAEPERGQVINNNTHPIWNTLFLMMRAREDLQGLEKLMRAHIEPISGVELPEFVIDGARMLVSAETMASIGLANEASMKYSADAGGKPTTAPVRPDVPMDEQDMADWLAGHGPDPSQGGSQGAG